jgi:hypothetical protein
MNNTYYSYLGRCFVVIERLSIDGRIILEWILGK